MKLGIDPDNLTDEEWAERFQEWVYVYNLEIRNNEAVLKKVLYKLANDIFS